MNAKEAARVTSLGEVRVKQEYQNERAKFAAEREKQDAARAPQALRECLDMIQDCAEDGYSQYETTRRLPVQTVNQLRQLGYDVEVYRGFGKGSVGLANGIKAKITWGQVGGLTIAYKAVTYPATRFDAFKLKLEASRWSVLRWLAMCMKPALRIATVEPV